MELNMSDSSPTSTTPANLPVLSRDLVLAAVNNPTRLAILRELCAGEPLGVCDLAPRVKCTASHVSKHMAVLVYAGMVVRGRGKLYRIPPQFQPTPAQCVLEFGHCLLRLDHPSTT